MTQCTVYYSDNVNSDNYCYFYYDSDSNSDNNSGDDKNNYLASLLNFFRIISSLYCRIKRRQGRERGGIFIGPYLTRLSPPGTFLILYYVFLYGF
jgi:hypothetical protein